MTEALNLCHFCNAPTVHRKVDELRIPTANGVTITKPQFGPVCDNPECEQFGEHVALAP